MRGKSLRGACSARHAFASVESREKIFVIAPPVDIKELLSGAKITFCVAGRRLGVTSPIFS